MRIITKRDIILGVVASLEKQYAFCLKDPQHQVYKETHLTLDRLRDLDLKTCTEEDVREAMPGYRGWTSLICDECNKDHEILVHFGGKPDYDTRWEALCLNCLRKAVAMAEEAEHLVSQNPHPTRRKK